MSVRDLVGRIRWGTAADWFASVSTFAAVAVALWQVRQNRIDRAAAARDRALDSAMQLQVHHTGSTFNQLGVEVTFALTNWSAQTFSNILTVLRTRNGEELGRHHLAVARAHISNHRFSIWLDAPYEEQDILATNFDVSFVDSLGQGFRQDCDGAISMVVRKAG